MNLRFYTVKSFVTALKIVTAVLINGNSLDYKTDKDVIAVSCTLTENDTLKIPNIKFDVEKEFKELEKKPFKIYNNDEYIIDTAIQTIQFELDKKGGKIKSEAGMGIAKTALMPQEEASDFSVDNTFTIFLKEKDKDKAYFAGNIENIKKFQ